MTLRLALPMLFFLLQMVNAHMQMSWPYPIRSKFDIETLSSLTDYSYTAPLLPDGSNFPCKGYHKDSSLRSVVTYQAGSKYNMTLTGTAVHNGGSCQLSLSYDQGQTFKVIKSMIGGCPITKTYDFTIPQYAPAGSALFAWTWFNMAGNREMYMDCAEVAIVSSTPSRVRRHTHNRHHHRSIASIASLPDMFIANVNQADQCSTTEGSSVVFPNPGDDVTHGEDLMISSGNGYTCAKAQTSGYSSSGSAHKGAAQVAASFSAASASSSTAELPSTTRPAAATSSAPITVPSENSSSGTAPPNLSNNAPVIPTISPSPSSSLSSLAPSQNTTIPSLPSALCTPNTIYCNTPTTFSLCNPLLPSSSYPSFSQYTYMGATASGTKCIDGAIRRENAGPCTPNGGIRCVEQGRTWLVCDQGGEVDMGGVGAGMVCRDGMVIAAAA